MKTIGIIGGMSWVSTMDYYRYINELVAARLGGTSSAEILLHSVDFAPIERMQAQGDWDKMGRTLADSARRLEQAGADCVLIGTNTMHKIAPAVESAISVPLIHIADASATAIKNSGLRQIALLGTRYTMEQDFMRARLEANGVSVIVPSFAERRMIHDVIYRELVKNVFTQKSRSEYLEIMSDLQMRGAEGMLLACTEIPMLVKQEHTDLPLFDTTYQHAVAAVDFALAEDRAVRHHARPVARQPIVQRKPIPPVEPVRMPEPPAPVAPAVTPPAVPTVTPTRVPEPPTPAASYAEVAQATMPTPQQPILATPMEKAEPVAPRAPAKAQNHVAAAQRVSADPTVQQLQAVFGSESSEGFGSAVFLRRISAETDLESAAKEIYETFATSLFEKYGHGMWVNWSEVYRASGGRSNFHHSLLNHNDFQVSMQAGMLINNHREKDAARAAFRSAFASPDIVEQRVYFIGDGEALNGLLIASRRRDGKAVFLPFLMD